MLRVRATSDGFQIRRNRSIWPWICFFEMQSRNMGLQLPRDLERLRRRMTGVMAALPRPRNWEISSTVSVLSLIQRTNGSLGPIEPLSAAGEVSLRRIDNEAKKIKPDDVIYGYVLLLSAGKKKMIVRVS